MSDFLQTVRERVVIYDGAMGTNIQNRNPSLDDYWGKENCNEVLVLSRPDIIRDIHAEFFRVGCDVVETDTFGGARIVLAEFDLQDRVAEINSPRSGSPRKSPSNSPPKTGRGSSPDRSAPRPSYRHSATSSSMTWSRATSSRPAP